MVGEPPPRRGPPEDVLRLLVGARALWTSGLARPLRPDVVARTLAVVARDGLSPAAAYEYAAVRFPRQLALVDDRGTLTFAQAAGRLDTLAGALAGTGVDGRSRVAVLCRNHRDLVLTIAASSRLGSDVLLLNPTSPAPEVEEALALQGADLLVHDDDLAPALARATGIRALAVQGPGPGAAGAEVPAPGRPAWLDEQAPRLRHWLHRPPLPGSRYVLLTSGTTGRSRAAARATPLSLDPLVAVLSRIPLRVRDVTLIASPLFHAWGFGQLSLAMVLSSTVVLRSRFDPEATLQALSQHRVRVLVAVPAMLHAMVELPAATRRRYDTSSLQVVASSGSALPGDLATRFMDAFGDVLYNVYGSTEAAWATIATPAELRADPTTSGRPPVGTELLLVDGAGRPVGPGGTGRILVRNSLVATPLGHPTGPGLPAGFVATGDLGRLSPDGLLHVVGREDDLIVTGGENVHPLEVEDVLLAHPDVLEAAVVGVPDPRYGQRVQAVVVLRPGATLTEAALKQHARARLARHKVPRQVRFAESLPRTATGKPLHRELRAGS